MGVCRAVNVVLCPGSASCVRRQCELHAGLLSQTATSAAPAGQVDPVVRKQKAFHQAKLAMRRLRAQAERKRAADAPIGNSLILVKAALSLIRGGDDVDLGWQEEAARTASVLCFDEMQVG